jgi:hypothetical protein
MQHSSDIRFYGEFSPYLQDSSNMLDIVIQGIARPSFKKLSSRPNRAYDTNSKLRTLQNVRCFHIIALSSVERLFLRFSFKNIFPQTSHIKAIKKGRYTKNSPPLVLLQTPSQAYIYQERSRISRERSYTLSQFSVSCGS